MKTSELIKALSDSLTSEGDVETFVLMQVGSNIIIDPIGAVGVVDNELMVFSKDMEESILLRQKSLTQLS